MPMRKIFFFLIPLLLALLSFAFLTFILNRSSGKGALQVTANPKSNVYLNGKLIGQTPLCKCELPDMLETGDYNIRLVAESGSFPAFSEKITISKSVLTVVDWTFDQGTSAEGSIINLTPLSDKKQNELLISSFPSSVSVSVDNDLSGVTPVLFKKLTESDHEIKFAKEGYKEKVIRVRTVSGYKLSVSAFLGVEKDIVSSPTPSSFPTPTASSLKIEILETPTGFLRVRESNSLNAQEITRVNPGEVFEFVEEKEGWILIKLKDEKKGWVSAQYVRKI